MNILQNTLLKFQMKVTSLYIMGEKEHDIKYV